MIRTDHRNLKYLLQQRLNNPLQCSWLTKLLGYDFEICYKKGKEKTTVDALSRITTAEINGMAITSLVKDLLEQIRNSWSVDSQLQQLIVSVQQGQIMAMKYAWLANQLCRKWRLVVGKDPQLQANIIKLYHSSAMGRHSKMKTTLHRITGLFY